MIKNLFLLLLTFGVSVQGFQLLATPLLFERLKTEEGEKWRTRPSMGVWLRDQEFVADKRKLRVVCIGGSVTYGFPMPEEGSYPHLLEASLQELYPEVDPLVVSMGLLNGRIERLRELFDEVMAMQPHMVVLEVGNMEVLAKWGAGESDEPPAYLGDRSLVAPPLDRSIYRGLSLAMAEKKFMAEVKGMLELFQKEGVDVILLSPGVNLKANPIFDGTEVEVSSRVKKEVEGVMGLLKEAPEADIAYKVRCLERVLSLVPVSPSFHFIAAGYFEEFGMWEEAKEAYEKAMDRDDFPLRPRTTVRTMVREVAEALKVPFIDGQTLANGLSEKGMSGYSEYFDHLHPRRELQVAFVKGILKIMGVEDKVLEMELNDPLEKELSWNNRILSEVLCKSGYALAYCGEGEMAQVHFQKSLELNPSNLESLISLSGLLLLDGEDVIPMALLLKVMSHANWVFLPDHLKVRLAEGLAILRNGPWLSRVMEQEGENAKVDEWSSVHAFRHMAMGQDENAIPYFKKALEKTPLHPLLLKGLEYSCQRSGRWVDYLQWLKGRLVDRRSRDKVMVLMKKLDQLSENDEELAQTGIELIRLFLGLEKKRELLPWITLAQLHGRLDELHRSREALERALLLSSVYDLPLNIKLIEGWVEQMKKGVNPFKSEESQVTSSSNQVGPSGNTGSQDFVSPASSGTGVDDPESNRQ